MVGNTLRGGYYPLYRRSRMVVEVLGTRHGSASASDHRASVAGDHFGGSVHHTCGLALALSPTGYFARRGLPRMRLSSGARSCVPGQPRRDDGLRALMSCAIGCE